MSGDLSPLLALLGAESGRDVGEIEAIDLPLDRSLLPRALFLSPWLLLASESLLLVSPPGQRFSCLVSDSRFAG